MTSNRSSNSDSKASQELIEMSKPSTSIFNHVPDDISLLILNHLGDANPGTIINFTRSCQKSYSLFSQTDTAKRALQYFNHALKHASIGNWKEVDKIVSHRPDLLICIGTMIYCGRKYKGTLYQIGLKNGENGREYHNQMIELFDRLPNGKTKMAEQYFEVFPKGKMFHKEWDINKAKQLLNNLITVLHQDKALDKNDLKKMSAALDEAYKNYSNYINATLGTDKEGLVCDPAFLAYIVDQFITSFASIRLNRPDLVTVEHVAFYQKMVGDDFINKLPTGILRALASELKSNCVNSGEIEDVGSAGILIDSLKANNWIEKMYVDVSALKKNMLQKRDVNKKVLVEPNYLTRKLNSYKALCQKKMEDHEEIYTVLSSDQFVVSNKQRFN